MKFIDLHKTLTAAGFKREFAVPDRNVYELHSGAFSVQVRHSPNSGHVGLFIAYRAAPGGAPMAYRPWSLHAGTTAEAAVAEALAFLRVVEPAQCGGD